ncbi:lysylphosphatidylglycerol synthase transmembrane domain-containing protein [Peptostreptococcus equinus]|uniref:Phosphatidylglycerol lysyltransferase n=1 Tax=Peptostreptococcus equinus TaxID=3003601 RepID=A0ABY7JQK6_9FIRM|nr:lysylphosphatidylglycerol synthase transmembrane domain-containing protein [Peptostreptococcus sp. CBA3647]WAW14453.1 lysylphosphatidylglycerol synthase transmembrane domain-containing protein [Peptostreptococcus sp. CBA3647]
MDGLQSRKKQIFGILFIIVFIGVTMAYVLKDESIDSIMAAITSIHPSFIVLAVVLMLFYIACEGINIWITMRALKQKASLLSCLGYGFVGFYFSGITPSASGGQPAQVYFMKRHGISITSSSLSLMVLLFAHQLIIVILGIFGIFVKTNFDVNLYTGLKLLLVYGFISNTAILLGIFLMIFNPKIVYKFINLFALFLFKINILKNKEKWTKKMEKSLKEYSRGAKYMKENPLVIIKVSLLTFVQVVSQFAIPFVIFIGFKMHGHTLTEVISTQAILNIAVSSLPIPGAVGATESVFLQMFSALFGKKLVIPAMLLTRFANFYLPLIVSAIISLLVFMKYKKVE